MTATNGGCRCSDCSTLPDAAPSDHLARLEATDDIWPTTEGA